MKARIDDAATDIAAVGAWDAALQRDVLAGPSSKVLEEEAAQARLFLIWTGGDGGGPVDVYVDEEMPASARRRVRKVGRKAHLLSLPSGGLMVGGVEDYRSSDPKITGADSVVAIEPGDYAVACFYVRDPESTGVALPNAEQRRAALGEEEYRYYERINRIGLAGLLNVVWAPVLWPWIGWWALGAMFFMLVAYSNIAARLERRNTRYQAAVERVNQLCKQAMKGAHPTMILTLRRVAERGRLRGGSVRLESPEEA
jgi:hypothetical protein